MNQFIYILFSPLRKITCRFFLSFLFLFFTVFLLAQPKEIVLDNGELLDVNDGMSGRLINCIYEDSDGFIWVGTSMGINRYDGHRFRPYSNGRVSFIIEDKNKCIWLVPVGYFGEYSTSEIEIINPITNEKKTVKDLDIKGLFLDKKIINLRQDDTYNLWLSTSNGEVYKYDGIDFYLVYKNNTGNRIKYVLPINENEFIFQESNVLIRWTKAKGIVEKDVIPEEVLPDKVIAGQIFPDNIPPPNEGEIWLGENGRLWMTKVILSKNKSKEKGLSSFDYSTKLYYKDKGEAFQELILEDGANITIPQNFVLGKMSDENLWYFWKDHMHCYDTTGKLLTKFFFKDKEQNTTEINFTDSPYYGRKCIYGKDGTIWLATLPGVLKFSDKSSDFQKLLNQLGEKTLSTRGIIEIDADNLLVCTYDLGLLKVDLKDNSFEKIFSHGLEVYGMGMAKDRNGTIWIGSHTSVLYKYTPTKEDVKGYTLETFRTEFRTQFQIPYYDSFNGRLWIGAARGGLFYFDYDKEEIVSIAKWNGYEELKEARIYCFFQNDQKLWVGTNMGIYLVDQDKGVLAWHKDFLIKEIKGIHHADDGNIWLAGNGGLLRWNPSTNEQRLFSEDDGFPDDYLYTIYPDGFGFFWLSSNKGLIRFNATNFEVNAFLPSSGITHEEFNLFSHYKDRKGRFYFGGLNGFTIFDPADFFELKLERPQMKLTGLRFVKNDSGKPVNGLADFGKHNKIDWLPTMKSFQISFALQDYSLVNKQSYAYMIEGLDSDWIYMKENYLRFNQLPYGNYNLKIKGIGGKGLWSAPINLPLKVIQPFYKSWWFFTILGLGLLGFIFSMFRWRLSSLEKEVAKRTRQIENDRQLIQNQYEELELLNKAKDRFYTIIAHDLRDPVTSFKGIAGKINYLIKRNEPTRVFQLAEYVEESADNLSKLLENLLSWAEQQRGELLFRPSKHKFESLVKEVFEILDLFASTKSVTLRYNGSPNAEIFGDFHMLATILRNLVHNAIKFSRPNGNVIVDCKQEGGNTVFTVSDFGVGVCEADIEHLFKIKTVPTDVGTMGEKGTGLGLVLCHDLVVKHQGEILVHSKKGEATVFTVSIPFQND